jgi:amino acid adenylation domain-containing protein/non-ribosomal peptide synthase protein (TIGR01720 family)
VNGFPLLAAQTEIWLDEQLSGVRLAYSMADCLDISGDLDLDRFRRAMLDLSREAQCLRARFVIDGDEPRQIFEDLDDVSWDATDLSGTADPVATAMERVTDEVDRPFDLAAGPLFFLRAFRVAPRRHLVLWQVHHLLIDGFSRSLLYPRWAELYRDPSSPGTLPPFTELLDAQEAYLAGPDLAADRRYWADRTAGCPAPGTWSGDVRARGRRHLRRTATLSSRSTAGLRALASASGTSLPTVVCAATSLYTHRLTGRDDFTLTLPVAGRATRALRRVPGMTANYLPVVQRIGPATTVGGLLTDLWQASIGALRHQRYRGCWIRRDLAQGGGGPSFGPMVNMLTPEPSLDLGNCTARAVNLSTGITDDVIVTCLESPQGLTVHLNTNPDVYSVEETERHLARLTDLLTRLPEGGLDARVAGLDIRDPAERSLIAAWNATDRHTPAGCVVDHVRRWAADTEAAGRVAVQDDDGELTYGELDALSWRAARRLAARGVAADDVVAVMALPGAPLVTAICSVLAAGAAWTPCEVDDPAARTAGKLADSGARLLLAGPGCEPAARAVADARGSLDVVHLTDLLADAPPPGTSTVPGPRPATAAATGDTLAYVLFTSGSTGRPKGAMVHRAGMLNHLHAKIEDLGIGAGDCVVHNAPVTFDVSVWQMLAALVAGARTRAVSRSTAADPDALFGTIRTDGVTVLEVVPSLLRAALDVWEATGEPPALDGLRRLVVTGEALPADLCERWFRIAPSIPLVNAYGPTECSDDVTHAVITSASWAAERAGRLAAGGRVPIGRALRNTRLYVLDDHLCQVGIGVPGELYVGGAGVGRGYVADPRRTALAFLADPFDPRPGARMYRTGDRVVREADGQLAFIERVDHQVKIRGHRVELGDVEAVLRSAPGVRDAAAAVIRQAADAGETGQGVLAGYLVTEDGGPVDPRRLRDHVESRVPAYMWPARYVVLPVLPLTANGKVDRARLPRPDDAPPVPPVPQARPAGGSGAPVDGDDVLERVLAAFARAVGVPQAGPDDDFFALGGDSISALRLVSGLRRSGWKVMPRDVYQHRTSRALAARVRATVEETVTAPVLAADDGAVGDIVLTPIMHQLRAGAGQVSRYAQYVVLDGPAGLDLDGLRTAVQHLLDHHDALRMRLTVGAGNAWRLAVRPAGSVPPSAVVGSWPGGDGEAGRTGAADWERCVEWCLSRLDPQRGIMAQVALAQAGSRAPVVVMVVHHLAVDGVSWRVLIDDLAAVWRDVEAGRPPALEPVATSFRAWTRTLARDAVNPRRMGELGVWKDVTGGSDLAVRPPRLGCSGRLDPVRDVYGTAGRLRVELPRELTAALLTDAVRVFDVEINDILLTGLLLALLDGDDPGPGGVPAGLVVDLEGHGREYIADGLDLTRTVGWFTSIFPVRLDLGRGRLRRVREGGADLVALVHRVRRSLRRLPDHGLGYGLLSCLNDRTAAQLSRQEEPHVGFNYLGRFDTEQSGVWGNHRGTPVVGTAAGADRPLNHVLEVTPITEDRSDGPHLVTDWLWATGLVPPGRVEELAERWHEALSLLARTALGARGPVEGAVPAVTRQAVDPGETLPVGPLQQGLLFLSQLRGDGPDPYVLQLVIDIGGELDPARLREATRLLLDRHPQLGSAFRFLDGGEAVQVLGAAPSPAWSEHDLTGGADVREVPAAAWDVVDAVRAEPFVLDSPPLLRFTLIRLAPRRHLLALTAHHIVLDGWSIPILLRELVLLYRGADLPEAEPYRRYLLWLATQDREAALTQWKEELAGLDGATLVRELDPDRPVADSHRCSRRLDDAHAAELTAFCRGSGLTQGAVLQACWALLLAETTGLGDVVFGSVVSGRPPQVEGVESMVGMFLNTVPLRTAVTPEARLVDVAVAVQDEQARMQPHTCLPLGDVFSTAGLGELFDTVVVIENFPMETVADRWADAGLRLSPVRFLDGRHYPLSLVVELRDGVEANLDHLPHVVDDAEAARLVDRYLELVRATVSGPHLTVAQALRWSPRPPAGVPVAGASSPPGSPPALTDDGVRREEALRETFAEALGLGGVDGEEDFFALGGDSISAIRLVAGARRRGLAILLRDVLTHRTPRSLAHDARWVDGGDLGPAADDLGEALLDIDDDELDELDPALDGR